MAATIKQIKAACKGCTAEFVLNRLEAGATVEEAVTAFAQVVNEDNEELKAENEELKATIAAMEEEKEAMEKKYAEAVPEETENGMEEKKPKAEKEKPEAEEKDDKPVARSNVKPVARANGKAGMSARQEWTNAIAEAMKLGHISSRHQACSYVNKQNKGLRQRMLEETQDN